MGESQMQWVAGTPKVALLLVLLNGAGTVVLGVAVECMLVAWGAGVFGVAGLEGAQEEGDRYCLCFCWHGVWQQGAQHSGSTPWGQMQIQPGAVHSEIGQGAGSCVTGVHGRFCVINFEAGCWPAVSMRQIPVTVCGVSVLKHTSCEDGACRHELGTARWPAVSKWQRTQETGQYLI
jgi:hypothetical protein